MTKPSLELLTYNIGEGAAAFSTTRCGADEADRYSSFNINMYCGDSPEHVSACRQLLSETIGIALPNIIVPHRYTAPRRESSAANISPCPRTSRICSSTAWMR